MDYDGSQWPQVYMEALNFQWFLLATALKKISSEISFCFDDKFERLLSPFFPIWDDDVSGSLITPTTCSFEPLLIVFWDEIPVSLSLPPLSLSLSHFVLRKLCRLSLFLFSLFLLFHLFLVILKVWKATFCFVCCALFVSLLSQLPLPLSLVWWLMVYSLSFALKMMMMSL